MNRDNQINIDQKALFSIEYGLYAVTSNDGTKDNALIVNTVVQLTSSPLRIGVALNKTNYSHSVIKESGKLNVNCLSVDAPFKVFEAFGFSSGKDRDKFAGCSPLRSANGLAVLPKYINSYISLSVEQYIDLGTHGMFICTVDEAATVSSAQTMTYSYYHKNVKPKPSLKEDGSLEKKYICTVCGYVHEGELPEDFECPLCRHGKEAFEQIK